MEKHQANARASSPTTEPTDQYVIEKNIDKGNDDALAFAAEHHVGTLTPEEDRKLLRKIDMTMLPIVSLLYLMPSG